MVARWALGALAVTSIGFGALAISRSAVFHARAVQVKGAAHLSSGEVVDAARVSEETNVLWLDEEAIEARLETHAWIRRAEVSWDLPWTIRIAIVERAPLAVAEDAGRRFLVAGDGTVLGPGARHADLPRILLPPPVPTSRDPRPSVTGAARALAALDPGLRTRVRRIWVGVDGTLELRLRDGPRVRFGSSTDLAAKAAALGRVLRWSEVERVSIRRVEVVTPAAPAVVIAG